LSKMQNPIYAKVEYENAISARREILSAEIDLLNSIRIIQKYGKLREEELLLKIKLKRLLRDIKDNLRNIIASTPKTERIEKEMKEKREEKKKKGKPSIEDELRQIREELRSLS